MTEWTIRIGYLVIKGNTIYSRDHFVFSGIPMFQYKECVRNLDLGLKTAGAHSTKSQKPQNQRVQKVMSQSSAGSWTRCARSNAFPEVRSKTKGINIPKIGFLWKCTENPNADALSTDPAKKLFAPVTVPAG